MVKLKSKDTEFKKQPATRQDKLAQKKQAQLAKSKLTLALSSSLIISILIGLPLGLFIAPKTGLMIALAITCAILSYLYPRKALWAFLVYLPFGGTITYWLGEGNLLFQLAKDIFYIPALIGLIVECRKKGLPFIIPRQLAYSLGLVLFFALLTLVFVNGYNQFFLPDCDSLSISERFVKDEGGQFILNENQKVLLATCKQDNPLLQGLYGLKIFLGYVPLIFCTYYLIKDKKTLFFLGRLLVVLCLICCLLGLAQYWMLKTGRCASTSDLGASGDRLFKATLQGKCLVGGALLYTPEQGVIRLPGTFVSPWHWAWFLSANAGISFAVAFCDPAFLWRISGVVSLGLVFINSIICGQRQAIAFVPLIVSVLLISTGQLANFKRSIVTILGISIFLFVGLSSLNPTFIQERVNSFVGRWNQAPPQQFIIGQFEYAISQQKGYLGRGLGTATNSARSFGPIAFLETYYPKLWYEIGPFGLLAFIILTTHLTYLSFKTTWSIKDKAIRNFATCFSVFIPIMGYFTFWYPLDTDPVNVYYWLFAGTIFKCGEVDKQEQKAKASQPESKSKLKIGWRKKLIST